MLQLQHVAIVVRLLL